MMKARVSKKAANKLRHDPVGEAPIRMAKGSRHKDLNSSDVESDGEENNLPANLSASILREANNLREEEDHGDWSDEVDDTACDGDRSDIEEEGEELVSALTL
jgi:hypothetical protein